MLAETTRHFPSVLVLLARPLSSPGAGNCQRPVFFFSAAVLGQKQFRSRRLPTEQAIFRFAIVRLALSPKGRRSSSANKLSALRRPPRNNERQRQAANRCIAVHRLSVTRPAMQTGRADFDQAIRHE